MILGLCGPSGSRKTAVAKHLAKQHGFSKIHAGKPIKSGLAFGFNLTPDQAKDMPTMKLGGATPRAPLEAFGNAVHEQAPMATSAVMRPRIARRVAKGQHVVVDGVRSPIEANTIRQMGGVMVRVDNGTPFDGRKPMDMRSATIHTDYTLDTSGSKKDRKTACDRMFADNPEWMK
jgi:dephospho-CoA kinase